jgi:hypothetical protein
MLSATIRPFAVSDHVPPGFRAMPRCSSDERASYTADSLAAISPSSSPVAVGPDASRSTMAVRTVEAMTNSFGDSAGIVRPTHRPAIKTHRGAHRSTSG